MVKIIRTYIFLSKHLSGYAFDIRVNCVNYNELNGFVKTLPGFHQFLTQEGGLVVWHLEFNEELIPANTAVFTPLSSDYGWTTNRVNDYWIGSFNQGNRCIRIMGYEGFESLCKQLSILQNNGKSKSTNKYRSNKVLTSYNCGSKYGER
ncbi:MAG: hypothetical protein LBI14_05815 [Treponema sp.]|nr:hypothetical protein [Treponema sp.]